MAFLNFEMAAAKFRHMHDKKNINPCIYIVIIYRYHFRSHTEDNGISEMAEFRHESLRPLPEANKHGDAVGRC